MARTDPFDGLSEFLAIIRRGSFRAAAIELGVTAGAVSQAVRTLERRLGVPLFHRTTRMVALTEAGERLLARLEPAAETILGTLDELTRMQAAPSGTLRLLVERSAVAHVIEPVLPAFHHAWPEVRVEVTVDENHADLVGRGYDAGIRIGEYIARDMVAVRVSRPFRWLVLGSPGYFAARGRPAVPEDIAQHACIRFRRPEHGDIYRWEFERDGQAFSLEPAGPFLTNDGTLLRALAIRGLGLIYTSSLHAGAEIADGTLEPVLEAFAPAAESLFIYFPRTSRNQPKLRAFIDACAHLAR